LLHRGPIGGIGFNLFQSTQAQNICPVSAEKPPKSNPGTVKGAAESPDSDFAVTAAAIMRLPLTDSEKAEAIRRLLAQK
jgi:hypothetical protein